MMWTVMGQFKQAVESSTWAVMGQFKQAVESSMWAVIGQCKKAVESLNKKYSWKHYRNHPYSL
jgi:hypothetical protein